MGWLAKLLGKTNDAALPLYNAAVARGREPHWYVEGAVPDTLHGRFDIIAAVLSRVLIRRDADEAGAEPAARLTERFVDDMDGQLREIGIGDIVVGKHIGKMMSMLGGRLGAYRAGLAAWTLDAALARNLYRGHPPDAAAVGHVDSGLRALHAALGATPLDALLAGRLA